MSETEVLASDLHPGDVIPNHCGILVGVRILETSEGRILVARADGSQFRTSIEGRILVRRIRRSEAMAA